MRRVLSVAAGIFLVIALSGCSKTARNADREKMAYAPPTSVGSLGTPNFVASGSLAGRTINVSSVSDIRLRKGEVVLTFDDGPIPGRTDAVLSVLDTYGVRATFLMVGSMARAHPGTARKVAAAGMTIGTHTQNHANLGSLGIERARAEINAGLRSIAAALIPTGYRPAPFFRFPYLSDTPALRSQLAAQDVVVLDVDVDSKDYFQSSPGQVSARTLDRLKARGSGIVLFHDIHARTANALPLFRSSWTS
jgi:peptidoglycan/xylan/chitin deacetylase (PgdA/CDA1 family)